MGASLLLGVDLGTTTCRAVVFDRDGNVVSAAAVETEVQYPQPRWAEVDPERWWEAVAYVIREAVGQVEGGPAQIASVGVSGLMHAPVLVDATGSPVAPVMLWMDQRCAAQCETLDTLAVVASPDSEGMRPRFRFSTTHTAAKLRWLHENQPAVLARAQHVLLPKDFIRLRLTGEACTDTSDAGGTGLFNHRSGDWAWDLVQLTGSPRALMPSIRSASERAGTVTPAAAACTGLAPGTPVAVGGADTFCTRLGAGPLEPGEVCIYLGTACWIARLTGTAPDGRQIVSGVGSTATTGAALRWVRNLLQPDRAPGGFPSDTYDELIREAAEAPEGAEGVFFLPHLMGERGPRPDPLACGAFVGLTLRHGRPHVCRAVLEGTVYQIGRILDERNETALEGTEVQASFDASNIRSGIACGGAARSPLWMQLLADVTELRLRVPATPEPGALGAAILAGVAAGVHRLDEAQARMTRYSRIYSPDAASSAHYDLRYKRYCQLDDLLMPWFQEAQQ